jgi:hypothetical protein
LTCDDEDPDDLSDRDGDRFTERAQVGLETGLLTLRKTRASFVRMTNTAAVLPIGATFTYERVAPFTYERSIVTTVVEGRNWNMDKFDSYIVRGGECVYPHQLR